MSASSEQILKEALALPLHERAELVEQLLATFQSPPDPHIDELWVREAEDWLDAYDRGELRRFQQRRFLPKSSCGSRNEDKLS